MMIAIILLSIVVIYLFFCIGYLMYNQRKFKEEVRQEHKRQKELNLKMFRHQKSMIVKMYQ